MKKLSIFVVLFSAMLFFTSCNKEVVKIDGNSSVYNSWGKIAIAEVRILPPTMPVLPLIDAGIYRDRVNTVQSDILQKHSFQISGFENIIGQTFKSGFSGEVLYGTDFYENELYTALIGNGITEYSTVDDKGWEVTVPENCANIINYPFDEKLGLSPAERENLSLLSSTFGLDAIAIVSISVDTLGVSSFGIKGTRYLQIVIDFYSPQGDKYFSVIAQSPYIASKPTDTDTYNLLLNGVSTYIPKMVTLIKQI